MKSQKWHLQLLYLRSSELYYVDIMESDNYPSILKRSYPQIETMLRYVRFVFEAWGDDRGNIVYPCYLLNKSMLKVLKDTLFATDVYSNEIQRRLLHVIDSSND